MRGVLLAAVFVSGCASYSHDRFVVVDVTDHVQALSSLDSDGLTLLHPADYIGQGIHYWDIVGCRFVLPAEAPNAIGQHLEIVEASDAEDGVVGGGDAIAWFDSTDGKIKINAHRLPQTFAADWAATWAHEVGHALGLGHIDGHAVMNPSEVGVSSLQPADIAAFRQAFATN